MSDDTQPSPPAPAAPTPPSTPAPTAAPKPPVPPAPIDYAIGAPKRPFTLPRYTFLLIKMMFGLIIVLGMGYFALVALNPKAREWATQGGKDGSGGPTPFKALNQILAIPAQAIGKTKSVVAASDARVGVLDKVIKDEEKKNSGGGARDSRPLTDIYSKSSAPAQGGKGGASAEKDPDDSSVSRERLLALAEKSEQAAAESARAARTAPVPVAVVAPPPPPGPAEMKLGGGITVTNQTSGGANAASTPFMHWVASIGVSGVSNSTPPRFLMNGKTVRAGEEVNKTLGVTFERLDAAAKLIYFRDKNGALVSRSY